METPTTAASIEAQQTGITPELAAFGQHKHIPAIIEKNVLTALSFYPELADTVIHFEFKQYIKSSVMLAQPVFNSLLGSRQNRSYRIYISALFRLTHTAIPIHQLPDEIMIGWIGHELGHIMDYKQRSNLGMVRFGLSYLLSPRYVKEAEQLADGYAVRHGLGHYLIATKRFILDHTELPQRYKDKIARLYVSPEEITEQVRRLEAEKLDAQRAAL
ncbi:hypothetical protein ACAW74_11215 [Fibrella sp. WM1]|uniref:hypothetical protein n=1 Tax=Fibrella musci TaxID=3242485 RepID=UPI00351FDAB5